MTRAEIWWADLAEPLGSEPGYARPAVIVSADRFNRSRIATVAIVPLYSDLALTNHAGNVLLRASDTKLDRDSVANVSQVITIDRGSLLRMLGAVPPSLMRDIDAGLRLALDL